MVTKADIEIGAIDINSLIIEAVWQYPVSTVLL